MRVFIAEKPSQGRDIAKVLGCTQSKNGYLASSDTVVTWGFGHLLQPAEPDRYNPKYKQWLLEDLPIIPTKWKLDPNPASKSQLAIVKGLLEKATEVVIATDADREGELIARLIIGVSGYKGPLKRLWLSALDDKSIKKALSELKDGKETENLFWAGLGRQRADWLTGMSYTRASSIKFGKKGSVFSVGRVQTPTLRLVVERDIEIENFVSKTFYTITGDFTQEQSRVSCDWIIPEFAMGDDEGRCLNRVFVEKVAEKCQGKPATIVSLEKKKKQNSSPLPFSLSDLQKAANGRFGYGAKVVLNAAQALYEKYKATTYPRSDCNYLPLTQFNESKTIFESLKKIDPENIELINQCDVHFKGRCWNDKKVSESSHHAIIPTSSSKIHIHSMSEVERNVYQLVVKQYLAQFAGNYVFNETLVEIVCEEERFKTKGIVPLELGWKKILSANKEDTKDQELPHLDKKKPLHCADIKIFDKKTTPPIHYNDATLLSAMKNCGRKIDTEEEKKILSEINGIGTEATRADIIETLKNRHYVEKKGKFLVSTDKGKEIIRLLPDELTSVVITANWEMTLDKVSKGKAKYSDFIQGIEQSLRENIVKILKIKPPIAKDVKNPCPQCGKELVKRENREKNGFWWGCSGFPNCKTTLSDDAGKPVVSAAHIKREHTTYKCGQCGKTLIKRNGVKGLFWGCSGFPNCKTTYNDKDNAPMIPEKTEGQTD